MSDRKHYGFFSLTAAWHSGTSIWRTPTGLEVEVSGVTSEKDGSDYKFSDRVHLGEVIAPVRAARDSGEFRKGLTQNPKRFRFWLFNLNTDEGRYVESTSSLGDAIDQMLEAGVEVRDIGVALEDPLPPKEEAA